MGMERWIGEPVENEETAERRRGDGLGWCCVGWVGVNLVGGRRIWDYGIMGLSGERERGCMRVYVWVGV
jgi:hypothetical protein